MLNLTQKRKTWEYRSPLDHGTLLISVPVELSDGDLETIEWFAGVILEQARRRRAADRRGGEQTP